MMYHNYKATFHRFCSDLMKDKYPEHAETIERMACFFPTEKDVTELSKLFIQVYESGYLLAINSYKAELQKLGISVSITDKKIK